MKQLLVEVVIGYNSYSLEIFHINEVGVDRRVYRVGIRSDTDIDEILKAKIPFTHRDEFGSGVDIKSDPFIQNTDNHLRVKVEPTYRILFGTRVVLRYVG